MSWLPPLVLALAAGLGLGLFYFGGLWLTVRRLPRSRHPVPLLLASFAARTAVAVAGFFFVTGDRWERGLVCLGGFVAGRFALTSRLRPGRVPPVPGDKEGVGR